MSLQLTRAAACTAFIAAIAAANYATGRYGLIPVGFWLTATAGTYFAGITFVLRDAVHDLMGRYWVLALIVGGAALSVALADPRIALASGGAFLLSELADLTVYGPLRSGGYIRAAVASNIVGALTDTVVFLALAGFPIMGALPGQMLAKLAVTILVVTAVGAMRAVLREPVRT